MSRFLQDAVHTSVGYADAISGELLKCQKGLSDPVEYYRANSGARAFLDPNDGDAPDAFVAFKRQPPSTRVFFQLQTLRTDLTSISWDFGDSSDPVTTGKKVFHTFPEYNAEYDVVATVVFGEDDPVEFDVTILLGTLVVPPQAGSVTILGTPELGETLSLDLQDWVGDDLVYTYVWNRETEADSGVFEPIPDATQSTYVLTEDELGLKIRAWVGATNSAGSDSASSPQVGPVVPA